MKMNLRIEPNLNTTVVHAQPMNPISSNKGFTLVEVMMVVAIIGAITLIGIPAFQDSLQKGAVKSASRSLMFHMKQARVTAMAESRNVQISFDAYSYTYDSYTCRQCKRLNVLYADFSSNLTVVKKNTVLPPPTIIFRSRGTANPNMTVVLASGTHTSNVVINIIGRAYVQ